MFTHKIFSKATKYLSGLSVGLMVLAGFPISALAVASSFNSLTVSSQTGTLTSGTAGSATYVVTVNRSGSGNLDVVLSVPAALPSGVSASFNPGTVSFTGNTPTSATSSLTITTTVAAPATTTAFTVSGTGDSTTRTGSATLTIAAGAPTTGTLTVTKVVVGGSLGVGSFPLFVDGSSVTSGVATTTSSGAHVVSETNQPNYTAAFSGNCDSSGNVNVPASGSAACTITNTYVPTTGSLTVNKVVVGGTATATNFALFVDGSSVTSGVATTTSAGVHVVSETPVSGYTGSFSGNCDSSGNVTVSTTTPAVCTLTNTFATTTATSTGTITVNKVVLNSSGATTTDNTAFTISLNGSATTTVSANSPAIFSGLTLDFQYLLSEATLAGYNLVSINPSATTTLTAGATSTTVTIVNQQQATSTPIANYLVTIDTPTITNFTVDLTGTASTSNSIGNAGQYDVQVNWGDASSTDSSPHTFSPSVGDFSGTWGINSHTYSTPGTYTVTAKLYHGSLSGNEGSATSTIQVTVPAAATSTTATINIHKVTNPGSFNADFNFSLNQGTTTVATTTANASTGDGSFTNVAPGTYKIVEGDTSLWNFTSVSCTGGAPIEDTPNHAVNVMVEAGDNITCTFTNTAETGIVRVIKKILASDGVTLASYDDTLFGVHAVGFNDNIGQFNGGATSTSLMPGSYTLTEDANADYDLISITSNTNASTTSGQFTVANGTTTEITVVNQQHASTTGKIVVHKAANPSDINQSFAFNLERGTTVLGTGTTTGTSTIEFSNLPNGTYKITEIQIPGWNYNGATCVYNGDSTGSDITFGKSIVLGDNYVVDCTFTNTATTGNIRVVKNVIDANNVDISDTHAFFVTLNGTSTTALAEGSDALYTGLATGTPFTIAENSDSGYDLVSITASSTVSVTAGTTTVVTITNKKRAAPVETSGGGGGGGGGFGPTGYATPPLTPGGSVLGASTDTSGGTGTTGSGNTGTTGNTGNTGNTGTTYNPRGASFDGSGNYSGGSTFLAQNDASTTDATTTDLVQMPSEEEMNQLAAVGAASSGAAMGSWVWWLLFLIILAILYYIYRRSRQA